MATTLKIGLLSTLLLAAAPAVAQQDDDLNAIDDTPHITVVGSASAEVVPDLATLSLGVAVERVGAAEASRAAAQIAASIIDLAKGRGIAAKDIRTEAVTLTQVFDDVTDPGGRQVSHRLRGYRAGEKVAVRVRALDQAGSLAQQLIDAGATDFDGITFSLENPGPVENKLVADAVRDARNKAAPAAAAVGAKLGRVLLIERPQPATEGAMPMARLRAASPAMPVEGGTQTLRSEMEVTWALEP